MKGEDTCHAFVFDSLMERWKEGMVDKSSRAVVIVPVKKRLSKAISCSFHYKPLFNTVPLNRDGGYFLTQCGHPFS
jgi:hypothetical protein